MELTLSIAEITYCIITIVVAYAIRGIAGFGSGLIAVPILILFLPLKLTVILIALLDYLASLTHGIHGRKHIHWSLIIPLLPFNIIGVLLAVYILQQADLLLLVKVLAVLIFIYALYYLWGYKPKSHTGKAWAIPAGLFGSLIGTLFSTGGPFYVIYLQLQALDKSAFRASFATIFLIDGSLRISSYFLSGLITQETIFYFALAIPLMLASLYAGEHIHTNISQRSFQKIIGGLLMASSLVLFLH